MTETPFLIAHLVRGQPAFDIAIQMQVEDEVWWILPSTGHRAYPYWDVELSAALLCDSQYGEDCYNLMGKVPKPPTDHPDFWHQPLASLSRTNDIIATLGIGKPKTNLIRRPL